MKKITKSQLEKEIKYWKDWKTKFIMTEEDIAWANKEITRCKYLLENIAPSIRKGRYINGNC